MGLFKDEYTEKELTKYLPGDEADKLVNYQNTATQIIDQQSQDLRELRSKDLIDDFRHMELQSLLNGLNHKELSMTLKLPVCVKGLFFLLKQD